MIASLRYTKCNGVLLLDELVEAYRFALFGPVGRIYRT